MSDAAIGAASRAAAARALARIRFDGVSLRAALPEAGAGLDDPRDRALVEATLFTVCRRLFRGEALLNVLLARPLPRAQREVHALLLVGLTQLDALDMAAHAVVDACVGATRLLRQPRHAGLVNAVLRRFLRERVILESRIDADESARFNHPPWLIARLREAWGEDADAAMLAAASAPPLWLRVNPRRATVAACAERLAEAGIEVHRCALPPHALRLPQAPPATALPGWDEGWMSVQDGAAQLAALAVDAQRGQRVLDACAAPGGKTAAMLETADALDLLALDIDPARNTRIAAGLTRLGLTATLLAADAAQPQDWWDGRPFDRILLDAPCSATGILRRQPDARWHRRAADIAALVAQQQRLLDALWPLLAVGGRLVYVTCSILPDENARQIDAFLARHPDARPVPLDERFGRPAGAGRQRLPGEDDMDGFFHAALQRY